MGKGMLPTGDSCLCPYTFGGKEGLGEELRLFSSHPSVVHPGGTRSSANSTGFLRTAVHPREASLCPSVLHLTLKES